MNVNLSPSPAIAADRTPISNQETLARSLQRLSTSARLSLPAAAGGAGAAVVDRFDAQGKWVQGVITGIQQATSAVQTADRFLGGLTEILSRLGDLAGQADDATRAPAARAASAQEFKAAQEQLRLAMGGNMAAINGQPTVAPAIVFNGIDLFSAGERPGSSADDPAALPKVKLRTGALNALVQQDDNGNFRLAATEATADVLKSALGDVSDARRILSEAGARLALEAVTYQVESENLSSALAPIRDEAMGGEFTRAATTTMLVQPGAALFAQANVKPQGAFQILDR